MKPIPQLVTMEGDYYDYDDIDTGYNAFLGDDPEYVAELLGIEIDDADFLVNTPELSDDDIAYLDQMYPEYMGVWPWLAKIGKGILKVGGKIGKGIANAVKRRRARRKNKSSAASAEAEKRRQLLLAQQVAAERKKKMAMLLIPAAVISAFLILRK